MYIGMTVISQRCMLRVCMHHMVNGASVCLLLVREVGIPYLESELSSLEIDDLSGDAHVAVVGKISYQLTKYVIYYSLAWVYNSFISIQLSNLQIESSSFMSGSVGLTLAITGISIDGSANWHYSNHGWYYDHTIIIIIINFYFVIYSLGRIHLSDRGTMSLGVSGATISMSVLLGTL